MVVLATGVASVLGAGGVVVDAVLQEGRLGLDGGGVDHVRVAGVALAVALVAVAVAGVATWRRRIEVAAATMGWATLVVLGSLRDLTAPPILRTAAAVAWLSAPGFGLVALCLAGSAGSPRDRRRVIVAAVLVVATGTVAATLFGGAGVVASLHGDAGVVVELPRSVRVALALHTACLAVGLIAVGLTHRGRRWNGRAALVAVTGAAWGVTVVAERLVHLQDPTWFRDLFRGTYEPWSLVLVVHIPLVVTIAAMVAIGGDIVVRPAFRRLPTGVVVLSGEDPMTTATRDVAAWLGDPSVRVHMGAAPGLEPAGYDRRHTAVVVGDVPMAHVEHDLALAGDPASIAAATALIGAALEADHLLAVGRAQLHEAARLSERLLAADAVMRDALAERLDRGPLQRLREARDLVRLGASMDDVVADLQQVTADVRALSHGVSPPELIDGPLAAVLPAHRGVPHRPLAPAIQTTAYLLAMADPAAVFHDGERELSVRRAAGPAPSDAEDRVLALGGRIGPDGLTYTLPYDQPAADDRGASG